MTESWRPSNPTDPSAATSPAEFVAAMRELRAWSGRTYRQLERRAEAFGETLPHSTLATALSRSSLPRAEMVSTFVRACGLDEEASHDWLRIRQQLAIGTVNNQEQLVLVPVRKSRRGWTLAALSCAAAMAMVLSLAGGAVSLPDSSPQLPVPGATVGEPPQPGEYRLRVARSGRCLSEQHGSGSGHLYEAPCTEQFPVMALERLPSDTYRVTTDHPEFGPGCMGIPFGSMAPGTEVEDGSCGKGAVEQYRWEPVAVPVLGFRIHPTHSGLCLGYPDDSEIGSATLRQLPCDSSLGQIFQLV